MIRLILKFLLSLLLFFQTFNSWSQTTGLFNGFIKDNNGNCLPLVNVRIAGTNSGTVSNDSGYFQLQIPCNKTVIVSFSLLGYQNQTINILLKTGTTIFQNIVLSPDIKNINEVEITNEVERASGLNRIMSKEFSAIPNPSGNFESLIKTMPGVTSNNELSSQYSVRGGNFDENLVYVNDVEVPRPYLVQTGQQEGLSFINPEMVSSVKFLAGGFEARYGDKMSSVLDVSYLKPAQYHASASASLLGATFTFEGISRNKKFTHITGLRYKTSQYLLSSLQTTGTYNPSFTDFQTFLNYKFSDQLELSFLGNFTLNSYNFIPQTRSTTFGTLQQAYNIIIYYSGQEADKYQTALGALTINYKPLPDLSLKLITSAYSSIEQETYDIEGQYQINELGYSPNANDSTLDIGVGTMLNHARNYLNINVYSFSHIGTYNFINNQLRWSIEFKKEIINDHLNEWEYIDSARYATPYSPTSINLTDFANANNDLNNNRIQGYIQNLCQFSGKRTKFFINGGIRFNYWSFNNQFLVTPRGRLSIKPDWNSDFMFFLAAGLYFQPPFYKEMRNFQGVINPNIKAQRSYHLVLGSDYNLKIWDRPFKFTSEIYYKYINDLIPYIIDDVELKYTALNNAVGYAEGIDLKLNGEFLTGIQSWASLSLLNTQEKRFGTYINTQGIAVNPGYYPRPTDQHVTFSLFFQDFLPTNPTYQFHIVLAYGSGMPVTVPDSKYFNQTFSLGPYERVDLGISKIFKNDQVKSNYPFFKAFKEFIVGVELFNMFNYYNTASYLWVHTVSTQTNLPNEFAVPNYLTARRLNLRISVKF